MHLLLALSAIAVSIVGLGWLGLNDSTRMRAHDADTAVRTPLTTRQRRLIGFGAAVPGLLLMLGGWWSSAMIWMGATVTLAWLWVLWLAQPRAR